MTAQPSATHGHARQPRGQGESAAHLVWRTVLVVEICLLVAVALGTGVGLLLSDALLTLVERVSDAGS